MQKTPQTKVDRALEALEERHADDPERADMLRRTRQFKASWLDLAASLADVRRSKNWQRWGYDSFESYFKTELKLRQETVDKLTGSYMFLHKRAPDVLKRDPLEAPMPSYHAVDFLRRAEERVAEDETLADDETMNDLRKRVLEDAAPVATVARLYKGTLFPVPDEEKQINDRKEIRQTASKLRGMLAETDVIPKKAARDVLEALARLLEELESEGKAA